jgi:hypothetical protein
VAGASAHGPAGEAAARTDLGLALILQGLPGAAGPHLVAAMRTGAEAALAAAAFPGGELLGGEAATEQAVRSRLADFPVLHFATPAGSTRMRQACPARARRQGATMWSASPAACWAPFVLVGTGGIAPS